MKVRWSIYVLVCCVLLCLTGCGSNKEAQRSVLRVGVSTYTQDDPFINALTDCLKEDLEDYETDSLKIIMTVRDGKNDQKLQDEVVEEILDAGCDILVVDLVDRTEPSNIIKMAKNENIPVIFFNREPVREDLMQWDKLYYVGGDARQSGTMQGEIAAQVIRTDHSVDRNADGKIQYVLLEGETGASGCDHPYGQCGKNPSGTGDHAGEAQLSVCQLEPGTGRKQDDPAYSSLRG